MVLKIPDIFSFHFRPPDFSSVSYEQFYFNLTAVLPEDIYYFSLLTFFVLFVTSLWDAWTGRVPTWLLLGVLVWGIGLFYLHSGFTLTFEQFFPVLISVFILCIANGVCVKIMNYDAFGMGDIKWSAVATFAYGLKTVFWAWVIGAWFAIIWLAVRRVVRIFLPHLGSDNYQGHVYVHFVPFLFLGLCTCFLLGL